MRSLAGSLADGVLADGVLADTILIPPSPQYKVGKGSAKKLRKLVTQVNEKRDVGIAKHFSKKYKTRDELSTTCKPK